MAVIGQIRLNGKIWQGKKEEKQNVKSQMSMPQVITLSLQCEKEYSKDCLQVPNMGPEGNGQQERPKPSPENTKSVVVDIDNGT